MTSMSTTSGSNSKSSPPSSTSSIAEQLAAHSHPQSTVRSPLLVCVPHPLTLHQHKQHSGEALYLSAPHAAPSRPGTPPFVSYPYSYAQQDIHQQQSSSGYGGGTGGGSGRIEWSHNNSRAGPIHSAQPDSRTRESEFTISKNKANLCAFRAIRWQSSFPGAMARS